MKKEMERMKIFLDMSFESDTNRNIQNIEASMKFFGSEKDEEEYYTVATLKVRKIIDILINPGELFFQMDSISNEMMECFNDCLYEDENGDMRIIGDDISYCNGFVYIDELRVNEEFRGFGLGKALVQEVIRLVSGELEVLIVLPFAIEDRDNDEAHDRVEKFWQSIGFKKIGDDTSFHSMMTLDLTERRDYIDEVG